MRKIEKNLYDIPEILNKENRKKAFLKNIDSAGYNYGKGLYKTASVENKLYNIYHIKCAYCEKDISDDDKHIEHYRPKSKYYWLAYSWDNLLLCCSRCNKAKSDKFPILNTPIVYNDEDFKGIHSLGASYDKKEQPLIINPEREDVLEKIKFNREGEIYSFDNRIDHTINEIFYLNRKELINKRIKIINTFIDRIGDDFFSFRKNGNSFQFQFNIKSKIKYFRDDCIEESEFYTLRYFILNNIEVFFNENRPLGLFVKKLVEQNDH